MAFDLAGSLGPIAIAAILWWTGSRLHRWARWQHIVISLFVSSIAIIGAGAAAGVLPANTLGGGTVLLSLVAIFLFAIVWSAPKRSLSSPFLMTLAGVALILTAIETSGRLYWRWFAPEAWTRTADAEGRLIQSSGMTCSPTAAVMLLASLGIESSEGEMAYLAGTSLFGTDADSIVSALNHKLEAKGWRAEKRNGDPETPFIAHIKDGYLGHAVVVTHWNGGVHHLDPGDGQGKQLSQAEFEVLWNRTAIVVKKSK